jgi:hypothetical protein
MINIRQVFDHSQIEDIEGELTARITASGMLSRVKPGMRIAITAGSRGIDRIPRILKTVIGLLREKGAKPFIVPAMGSHGGGTARGQMEMLESLGIIEKSMGVPVISSMETATLGKTSSGAPVFMDKNALSADGIVVINRVKLHTAYHGRVESGICKMVAVGLGKKNGAETMHMYGLGEVIAEAFRIARDATGKILFGVAILENAFDRTLDFQISAPEDFEQKDSAFLERCRSLIPRIPLKTFDMLIVDEMGKNISGTGMDTNIIGFWRRFGGEKNPDYKTLIVRDLTPESHGNAMGIGFADLIPQKLYDKIDLKATYTNGIASNTWSIVRIPITLENDRECVRVALEKLPAGSARVVRIKNTLFLDELQVSENLLPALRENPCIEITGEAAPMQFDSSGNLMKENSAEKDNESSQA